jgi:hypothetical protein
LSAGSLGVIACAVLELDVDALWAVTMVAAVSDRRTTSRNLAAADCATGCVKLEKPERSGWDGIIFLFVWLTADERQD